MEPRFRKVFHIKLALTLNQWWTIRDIFNLTTWQKLSINGANQRMEEHG